MVSMTDVPTEHRFPCGSSSDEGGANQGQRCGMDGQAHPDRRGSRRSLLDHIDAGSSGELPS
jgi:hypothetical protein